MGQLYAYDKLVETMATNPTGQFFGFEEKCPVGPQDSKINEDPTLQQL